MRWVPKARRLKVIAAWINAHPSLGLVAEVRSTTANTDRQITGTRLRRPGKGRKGVLLQVWRTWQNHPRTLMFSHNSAETYRNNYEVEQWLNRYIDEHHPSHERLPPLEPET